MAAAYDPGPSPAPKDLVRLRIGDTSGPAWLFKDEEVAAALARNGDSVLLAAADLLDALAARFAREVDEAGLGFSERNSQKRVALESRADKLRVMASADASGGGSGSSATAPPYVGGLDECGDRPLTGSYPWRCTSYPRGW